MDWNKFAGEVHQVAVEKGLWDKPVTFDEIAIECHAALARAWEEHKAGRPNLYHLCVASGEKKRPCEWDFVRPCPLATGELTCEHRNPKPRGVAAELAGCVLRLLDFLATRWFETLEIKDFPWGGNLLEVLNDLHEEIGGTAYMFRFDIDVEESVARKSARAIERIWCWAKENRVDMEAVMREVLEYNRRRGKTEGWV